MDRLLIFILVLGLAACSGAPKQIATYPQEKPVAASGNYVSSSYVYDAYLELEVRRPESTAERAIRQTENLGGYLADSQSWWVDGHQQISLSLRVPAIHFDELYSSLQHLGTVTSEFIFWMSASTAK